MDTNLDVPQWKLNIIAVDQDELRNDPKCPEITSTSEGTSLIGTIKDPRLGVTKPGSRCENCKQTSEPGLGQCLGHFGKIILKTPVFHPFFYKGLMLILLRMFNFHEYLEIADSVKEPNFNFVYVLNYELNDLKEKFRTTPIQKPKDIKDILRYSAMKVHNPYFYKATFEKTYSVITLLQVKGDATTTIPESVVWSFLNGLNSNASEKGNPRKILDELNILVGVSPKNLMIETFPVSPIRMRAQIQIKDKISKSKIDGYYNEIINGNTLSKSVSRVENNQKVYRGIFNILQGNADPKTSIKEQLTGKKGKIRGEIFTFTVQKIGTGVITGDSKRITPDQVLVGSYFADALTTEIEVTKDNIDQIKKLIEDGIVKEFSTFDSKFGSYSAPRAVANVPIKGDADDMVLKSDDISLLMREVFRAHYAKGKNSTYIFPSDAMSNVSGKTTIKEIYRNLSEMLKFGPVEFYFAKKVMKIANINLGDKVFRSIQDGDVVLTNRFPTISTQSIMARKAVITRKPGEENMIGIHYSACEGSNADFDGDTMDIQLPGTHETSEEVWSRMRFYKTMTSQRNGAIIGGFIQNPFLYLRELSLERFIFSKEEVEDVMMNTISLRYMKIVPETDDIISYFKLKLGKHGIKLDSCKAILSMIFPDDFNYSDGKVLIREGIFIEGELTKATVSKNPRSILKMIHTLYEEEPCVRFIDAAWKVTNMVSLRKGIGLNFSDVKLRGEIPLDAQELMRKSIINRMSGQNSLVENMMKIKNSNIKEQLGKFNVTNSEISYLSDLIETKAMEIISSKYGMENFDDLDDDQIFNIEVELKDVFAKYADEKVKYLSDNIIENLRNNTFSEKDLSMLFSETDFEEILVHIKGTIYAKLNKEIQNVKDNLSVILKGDQSKIEEEIDRLLEKNKTDMISFVKNSKDDDNGLLKLIRSGAKGEEADFSKTAAIIGPIIHKSGARVGKVNLRTEKMGDELLRLGYCQRSVGSGIDLSSYINLEEVVRPSILDTYMLTPLTGYEARKARQFFEPIIVATKQKVVYGRRILLTNFGIMGFKIDNTHISSSGQRIIKPVKDLLRKYQ